MVGLGIWYIGFYDFNISMCRKLTGGVSMEELSPWQSDLARRLVYTPNSS